MKLSQLFSIFPQFQLGTYGNQDITGIFFDSRKVVPGSIFVAVRGSGADGHFFIAQALKQGAIGLVVESDEAVPKDSDAALVRVADSRTALTRLASRYYSDPAKDLFCIGVTGTNGKTSVTYFLEQIFSRFGWPTGVMGTIDHHLGDKHWGSELTTPDPVTLQKRLSEFRALNARAVAFEVSSHALDQGRVKGLPFDVAIFTNLTRDHLDYHQSFEAYFAAKEKLFLEALQNSEKKELRAILNVDDPYGAKLHVSERAQVWTYGQKDCDLKFKVSSIDFGTTVFDLETPRGHTEITLGVPGLHNVYNSVAAIGAALSAGVSLETCREALKDFKGVPGRLETVPSKKGIHVFVDYAHTDDALTSVLQSLDRIRKQSGRDCRIICVFGCGGDRDRGKRPLMARAAEQGSDVVIVTSDNPRSESPEKIISDCLEGISKEKLDRSVFSEVDRRSAIKKALSMAKKGDVVLIAGKGHEKFQLIGPDKIPFDDVSVAAELLQ